MPAAPATLGMQASYLRADLMRCTAFIVVITLLLSGLPLSGVAAAAPDDLIQLLEQAKAERYRSPGEARRLNAAIRVQLANQPDPFLAAQTYLNDCWTLIEQDGQQGAEAAAVGLTLIESDASPAARALKARLALCQLTAQEYLGSLTESLIGYDKLQREAEMLADEMLQAEVQLARGELRSYLGQFADGLMDLQSACKIFESHQRRNESLYCLQAIAILYYRFQDYGRAIDYFNEVIPAWQAQQQHAMLADAYYNLARAQDGKGDTIAALANYEQMRQLSKQLGNGTGVAYAEQSIGLLYTRRNEAAKGLPLLDSSLKVFRELGDTDMTARLAQYRGLALQQLRRFGEAIVSVEESVRLYRSIDQQPGLEKSLHLLADILIAAGEFERAAQIQREQFAVHEQLDKIRRDEMLAQQRTQFDTEKKDQENRFLQNERELAGKALEAADRVDRLKTLVIVLTVLLLTVAGGFLVRQLRLATRLRTLALSDELTGIGNRRSVLTFLEDQIKLHKVNGGSLSVALLDIDKFKHINDRLGHAAGDEVLKAVAHHCQQQMRGHDKFGRTGGEEFLAVLPDANLTAAGDVARRLCEQVRELNLDHIEPGLQVTVSIGVSQWQAGDSGSSNVIMRADSALYEAKNAGRDQVRLRSN